MPSGAGADTGGVQKRHIVIPTSNLLGFAARKGAAHDIDDTASVALPLR